MQPATKSRHRAQSTERQQEHRRKQRISRVGAKTAMTQDKRHQRVGHSRGVRFTAPPTSYLIKTLVISVLIHSQLRYSELSAQGASARVVGHPLSRRRSMHSSIAAHASVLLPLSARTVLAAAAAIRAPGQSRAPAPAPSPGAARAAGRARCAWPGAASARAQTTVDGQHSAVGALGVALPCHCASLVTR
jgi:hypothetical protein